MDTGATQDEQEHMGDDDEFDVDDFMAKFGKRHATEYDHLFDDEQPSSNPSNESKIDVMDDQERSSAEHVQDHDHGTSADVAASVSAEVKASIRAFDEECADFSRPYPGNKHGLTGTHRLNLARSLGFAPVARRQTDQEHADALLSQGLKVRKRRNAQQKQLAKKKARFINGLDQLLQSLDDCKKGCFHSVDLSQSLGGRLNRQSSESCQSHYTGTGFIFQGANHREHLLWG